MQSFHSEDGIFPTEMETNETIYSDHLLMVPILVSRADLATIKSSKLSLCYEFQGQGDTWYNLISDKCTSVGAHYLTTSDKLNLTDEIAIRAVGKNGVCRNISVWSNGSCQLSVDGVKMKGFAEGGIRIRSNSDHVHISLPNCNQQPLVMRVKCGDVWLGWRSGSGEGEVEDRSVRKSVKLVVLRGLNHGQRTAHGLLGR